MEIFKLFGSIYVDNEKANKSISKTDKNARKMTKTFSKGIKTAAKWGAGIAAGAGIAISGAVALGKKVGNVADRLLDLNSITGMSTDEIQKWQHASVVAGTSTEAMTMASEKLTQTLDTMSSGTGKAAEAANTLGYSYEQLNSMNADERMNALISSLQGVEDKTKRAKLGTDLFGKKWAEIAPIVDLGKKGLQEAKDNANIFDNESLNNANKFRIMFDDLKDKIGFVALNLGMKLIPLVSQFAEFITKNMPTIQTVFNVTFEVIGKSVSFAVKIVQDFIATMREWIGGNEENLNKVKDAFMLFSEFIKQIFQGDLTGALDSYYKYIEKVFGADITNIFKNFIDSATALFTVFIEFTKGLWDKYGQNLINIIGIAFSYVKDTIYLALEIITQVFNVFKAAFSGDWEKVWQEIGKLIEIVWENIKTFIGNTLNAVVEILRNLYPILHDIGKNLFDFLWQGLKFIWNSISNWIKNSVIAPFIQFFKNILGDMLQLGQDILNSLLDGLKWLWDNSLYMWLFNKTAEFVNKFKDIDLFEIGRNILKGLINGLTNMIEKVSETVGNIADSVKNRFKEMLGIHSPSKVFEEYGVNVGQGLAIGIDSQKSAVKSVVSAIGESVKGGFDKAYNYAQMSIKRIKQAFEEVADNVFDTSRVKSSGGKGGSSKSYYNRSKDEHHIFDKDDDGKKRHRVIDKDGNIREIDHSKRPGTKEQRRDAARRYEKEVGHEPDSGVIDDLIRSGYAKGTLSASRGWHLVGEKGPELVDFKGGERVYTTDETKKMFSGRVINQYITINSPKPLNPSETARQNKNAMRKLALEW